MSASTSSALRGDELTASILRYLRRAPNQERDLAELAAETGIEPEALQITVERLHRRRLLIAPFIEPSRAGGAKLTSEGLRWLIAREGGVRVVTAQPSCDAPAAGSYLGHFTELLRQLGATE